MYSANDSLKWLFQQPGPRQVDESLLNEAMDVTIPKIVRVIFYLVGVIVPVVVVVAMVLTITVAGLNNEWRMLTGPTTLSSGKVLDVKTQKGSKGSITYIYRYEFRPLNHEASTAPVKGVSFSGSKIASRGDVVRVEYLEDDPKISRIAGSQMHRMPLAAIVAVPLVGIVMTAFLIGTLRYKKRWLQRLLIDGVSVQAVVERVKPGPKGSLVVEVRYSVEGVEVRSKTNLANLIAQKSDKEWLTALQESGQPVTILANRNKPKNFFLLELLFRAREKSSFGFGA